MPATGRYGLLRVNDGSFVMTATGLPVKGDDGAPVKDCRGREIRDGWQQPVAIFTDAVQAEKAVEVLNDYPRLRRAETGALMWGGLVDLLKQRARLSAPPGGDLDDEAMAKVGQAFDLAEQMPCACEPALTCPRCQLLGRHRDQIFQPPF
jgi:hypothetical protein